MILSQYDRNFNYGRKCTVDNLLHDEDAAVKEEEMKAEMVEVIKTETVEGKGVKEDPVRTVVRYWDKDGTLLFESEK